MAKYSLKKQADLWTRIDNAHDSQGKGAALEELVAYLFDKIPGVTATARNHTSAFQSEEIDVAISNERAGNGLSSLPTIFLVECKNWSSRVGSAEVAWFDWKVRSRGQSFGILVALKGISGKTHERTGAKDIVAMALGEKRQLMVLDRSDIKDVEETSKFTEIIKQRITDLVLNRAPF